MITGYLVDLLFSMLRKWRASKWSKVFSWVMDDIFMFCLLYAVYQFLRLLLWPR
jgi:hypothetical protein